MELPDDILEEIVRKLPRKSMVRFRGVSKSWRCMIDSFKFKPSSILFRCTEQRAFVVTTSHTNNDTVVEELTAPLSTTAKVKIMGSVNGLLLLFAYGYEFIYVWNPFTGYVIHVPTILDPKLHWWHGAGLSYNPDTDDYTVVLAMSDLRKGGSIYGEDCSYVMAASFKTMEWKKVRFDRYHIGSICEDGGVVVEGHLHWRVKKREAVCVYHHYENPYNTVVYFDAIANEFQEVPLPELGEDATITRLCVLRGCLCIICFQMDGYYNKILDGTGEIKAMTKYGDAESWPTLISLSRSDLPPDISPLYFTTNEEEVVIQTQQLVAYNLKSNSIRTIDTSNVQSFCATSFEPTLIKPVLAIGNLKKRKMHELFQWFDLYAPVKRK